MKSLHLRLLTFQTITYLDAVAVAAEIYRLQNGDVCNYHPWGHVWSIFVLILIQGCVLRLIYKTTAES